ncbi:MAG TPA: carboxypeptidase-like regulatory domain-containing protein [Bryobacteraceae bacterium]|nr:carboxypeptidase-like regulatory domain-containing protein [Bryobacteraceae bacterium]
MFTSNRIMSFATTLLLVAMCGVPALAQSGGTGALTVSITDQSGAVIVGATVRVSNAATNLTRTETTGGNGSYTFTLLPPGDYTVAISAPGFSTIDVPGVTVNVTETHVLNQRLAVSAQQQQVTVEAAVQTIQTENSTLGGVVEGRSIADLPLVTRNFTQIMGLSTGVNGGATNAAALGRGFGSIYTNGQNDISNTYQMDGVTVNNYGGGSADGSAFFGQIPTPSPDALQEFKVQTALYDASFGRNAGAQVNIVTRSGSNDLHGSLFEFFRNEDLNANDWFRNRGGLARGVLRQNQFGGTVGWRMIRDKLFFFGSYQGTRQVNGVSTDGSSTVSLPAQLTDNRTAAGLGAAFCPQNNSVINTTTFAGGAQVACDGSNINPVALKILNFKLASGAYAVPSPQQILNAGTKQAVGFSAFSIPATFRENQELANIDYLINPKHTLSMKAQYALAPTIFSFRGPQPPGAGAESLSGTQLETAKLTSLLTNRLVNEARFSLFYLRASLNTLDEIHPSDIGLAPISPTFNVMPVITTTGLFAFGGGGTDGSRAPQQTYEYSDQISWTHGRHTIRAGADVQRVVYDIDVTGIGRGGLTFNTFSDFLLGMSAAQNGSPNGLSNIQSSTGTSLPDGGSFNKIRANQMSAFVNDDFKLSQKLTLNLGLRWEYDGTGYDVKADNGGGSANWALDKTVPVPPTSGTYVGFTVANNFSGTVPDGVFRRPLNLLTLDHAPVTNFAPRIGFAWQPIGTSGKFVVRGGFGYFYQVAQGNIYLLELNNNPPIAARFNRTGAVNGAATLANPYNPAVVRGFFPSFLRTPTTALAQQGLDPHLLTPVTLDYSLNLQYAFTPSVVLEVGYVGTRGEHIISGTLLNTPQIATASNPVNCSFPSGCITTNTAANAAKRVPVLGIGPNAFSYGSNVGDSEYNSLQVTLRKRFSHGLQAQAAYTFGRTMTDISGINFVGGYSGSVLSNDLLNRAQMHGPADFDRKQRLVVSYTYLLPAYRKGQGWAGRALSDWGVSGTTVVQSGQGLTLTDPFGGGIYGQAGVTSRAQMCPGLTYADLLTSGSIQSRLNGFFNPSAVANTVVTRANPAAQAACPFPLVGVVGGLDGATGFGNTGRDILVGPGQFNWDISVAKNFKILEKSNLQLRSDFFNAFNHPQFSNPATAVNSTAFGQITSTTVAPRIIQFALRYMF